jgi:hypothetical protein
MWPAQLSLGKQRNTEVQNLNKIAKATQNNKYTVTINTKTGQFWPCLTGIQGGQHREVSLYDNDITTGQENMTSCNLQIHTMRDIQFELFTQIQLTLSFTKQV